MTVAFFGGYDPAYPRVRVLREALESQRIEVRDLGAPARSGAAARIAACLGAWARRGRGVDALIVPAFGHRDVFLASLLGHAAGIPVIFDPLVSRWDTQVGDVARVRPGGPAAHRLRASDRGALASADIVLCDTWTHADFYGEQFGTPRRKMVRIPVGADRATFERGASRVPPSAVRAPLDIVYVGGFLPLHGMATIVAAAALLERRRGAAFARFTLLGGGMHAHRTARDVAAAGLRSVRMPGRVPYSQAMETLAAADLALGIFGVTEKAGRVVPHKVFQAMALGVPTVTRRSPGTAEFFRDGEHLALVPAGDPEALAERIASLAGDTAARRRLGEGGRRAALEAGHPDGIGVLLADAVALARERTAAGRRA